MRILSVLIFFGASCGSVAAFHDWNIPLGLVYTAVAIHAMVALMQSNKLEQLGESDNI